MNGYFIPFVAGIPVGVVMSFMMGTVFFALINNSINYGPSKGVLVATGVALSDIIFTSVVLFGSQFIPVLNSYENYARIAGGVFIIFLGIAQIKNQKSRASEEQESIPKRNPFVFISEGFLLNILNPMNLVTWIAITAYLTNVYHLDLHQKTSFFSGAIIGIFLAECGISLGAFRLKRFLNNGKLSVLNYVIGGLFLFFGALLIAGSA